MTGDFLGIVRVSIIPSLQDMILEEEKHLNYLQNVERLDVSSFIHESEETLYILRLRLTQYQKYLTDNRNDKP